MSPFGLKHKGYNNQITGRDHTFDYLGQERYEDLGLNWVEFRHRQADPSIGRFFGVDPVSAEYMSISTYQFAHNNPVWKIEIEGLEGGTPTGYDVLNKEPGAGNVGFKTMMTDFAGPRETNYSVSTSSTLDSGGNTEGGFLATLKSW
ncbi:MAG: RHS repeat-associated core domain-containing protein [Bacteroidota bacterium]